MASNVYRFALGAPENPQSLLWRLWIVDDEVHLAAFTTSGEVSFTAYATGRWRITIDGTVSRWHRPKEFRPGWTRGPDLVLPGSAVGVRVSAKESGKATPIAWLALPGPGCSARIRLLFASPRAEETQWRPADSPGIQGVAVFPLRRAGALHLCRVDEPLGSDEQAEESVLQRSAEEGGIHGVIVSADQSGWPSLWETHTP